MKHALIILSLILVSCSNSNKSTESSKLVQDDNFAINGIEFGVSKYEFDRLIAEKKKLWSTSIDMYKIQSFWFNSVFGNFENNYLYEVTFFNKIIIDKNKDREFFEKYGMGNKTPINIVKDEIYNSMGAARHMVSEKYGDPMIYGEEKVMRGFMVFPKYRWVSTTKIIEVQASPLYPNDDPDVYDEAYVMLIITSKEHDDKTTQYFEDLEKEKQIF